MGRQIGKCVYTDTGTLERQAIRQSGRQTGKNRQTNRQVNNLANI